MAGRSCLEHGCGAARRAVISQTTNQGGFTMTAPYPAGVFCAATTPFNADLTVDEGLFTAHCKRLLENGCTGIAMLGTTGEANSLSSRERMSLLDAVIKSGIAPSKLLPGT